jgi:hypothetical protein
MKLNELKYIDISESDAFKWWFGNSKIRNDDGTPKIVYHATAADFKTFKIGGHDPTISGHAIWLTSKVTHQPAAHNTGSKNGFRTGVNVMPLYVRVERPLVIDDETSLEWARDVFANGSSEFPQLMPKQWADEVTKGGEYDGIIFDTDALGWGKGDEIVVFHPNQIKSALTNSGNFSKSNDDITEAQT